MRSNQSGNGQERDFFAQLVQQRPGLVKFLGLFLLLFFTFVYTYQNYLVSTDLYRVYFEGVVGIVKSLLDASGEAIELKRLPNRWYGEIWSHDGAMIEFTEKIDGLILAFGLFAAVVSWPGELLKKLIFAVIGVLVLIAGNVLRVALMLKAAVFFPLQVDVLFNVVFPLFLVCLAIGYFIIWTRISGRHPLET